MGKMVHNNSKMNETNLRSEQQIFATVDKMLFQLKQIDDKYSLIIKDRLVHINSKEGK